MNCALFLLSNFFQFVSSNEQFCDGNCGRLSRQLSILSIYYSCQFLTFDGVDCVSRRVSGRPVGRGRHAAVPMAVPHDHNRHLEAPSRARYRSLCPTALCPSFDGRRQCLTSPSGCPVLPSRLWFCFEEEPFLLRRCGLRFVVEAPRTYLDCDPALRHAAVWCESLGS